MKNSLYTIFVVALFSAVATLLHGVFPPYGLFLSIAIVPLLIRQISLYQRNGLQRWLALATWIAIAYIGGSNRNGSELLIQGDTNGNAFLVGTTSLALLVVLTVKSEPSRR
jgi:hypothetical protein